MNERIKELAEQVGFGVYNDGEIYTSRLEHLPITKDLQKFAELILKESFDAVINDGRFHDAKNIIRAAKVVAMEHFGVE